MTKHTAPHPQSMSDRELRAESDRLLDMTVYWTSAEADRFDAINAEQSLRRTLPGTKRN